MTRALSTSSISQASVSSSYRSECCAEYQLREVMTPEVWYSVHHSKFLFCLRFFDITLMSFCRVFVSFLGVPLGILLCTQRRLSFSFFPFSRTVCLVSSEGSHDPRGLIPDRPFAFSSSHFQSSTTLMNLFSLLDFSNFVPFPPRPHPRPRFRWKDLVEGLIQCVSFYCGCRMIGYAVSVFTPLFLLFHLSTARVRHVSIRMVSSI